MVMQGIQPFFFDTCCTLDRQAMGTLTGLIALGFGVWSGLLIHGAMTFPPRPEPLPETSSPP